jgi:hypothetical protein
VKIEVQRMAATPDGFYIGLRLEYTKNGPVRFAQVAIEDDVMDWASLSACQVWLTRMVNKHLDRERELLEEEPLPGL